MVISVRQAREADLAPIDALMRRSFPRLLKADYPPSVLVAVIPRISKANPRLIASGTYFVAEVGARIVGAGGWTALDAFGRGARGGHIRHYATDPDFARQGVASALMRHTLADAAHRGITHMDCMATRTAEPFYAAQGFDRVKAEEVLVDFGGIDLPTIAMARHLP